MITLNNIVRSHQFRERVDILLSVWVPLFLMIESGWGNTWAFAGGHMAINDVNTYIAFARGFFLEGLMFAMFKLTHMFCLKRRWSFLFVPISLSIGVFTMIVSAGCNVGYIVHGGEMDFVVGVVAQYMPVFAPMFKMLLGWLFPLGVAAYALFDIGKLVDDHILHSRHLDERSMIAQEAEDWRQRLLSESKKSAKKQQAKLTEICDKRAEGFVTAARNGDFSFGARALDQTVQIAAPATGRIPHTAISGVPGAQLPAGRPQVQLPAGGGRAPSSPPPYTIPAQLSQPPTFSAGTTQNIQIPPQAPLPSVPYHP